MLFRQLLFISLAYLSVHSKSLEPSDEYLLFDQSSVVSKTYKIVDYNEVTNLQKQNAPNDFLIGYNHPGNVLDAT